MHPADLAAIVGFLRAAEALKTVTRSGYTSAGERESVAEHTWRLCLMAMLLQPELPDVDLARLLEICIVHDLGEAVGGDIPAPEQARRAAAGEAAKSGDERRDLIALVEPLPAAARARILALWDEYESAATPEARLAKSLDKLETILQHTQGRNPPGFDYRFNLGYGRQHTVSPPAIAAMRELLDRETERRARDAEARPRPADRPHAAGPMVRDYRDDDWDAWLRMSCALFPEHAAADLAAGMREHRARDDAAVLVVERPDGTIAGVVEVGARPYADGCETSPVGYVEALYVDPDVRRRGFARALFAAGEAWARGRGYREMASDARLDNHASHAAHAGAGYEEVDRVVQFRKRLDGGGPDAVSR